MEILKILKTKRAKNKKIESKKFGKVEILKWKRAKIKKVESEKFGKIRNIEVGKEKK